MNADERKPVQRPTSSYFGSGGISTQHRWAYESEHRVGHALGRKPLVKTGHRVPPLDDRRHEFPHQVVAEHRGRLAFGRVSRAAGRLEPLARARRPAPDPGRFCPAGWCSARAIGRRPRPRTVDLGPFVAEAVAPVALGQRGAFPDAGRPGGELAEDARPIVHVRGRAGSGRRPSSCAVQSGPRPRTTSSIGPSRSWAKSMRWIVMSNRSPAPALSLYCRQPQLVSGQSRKRWLRKCRGSPSAPLETRCFR